MFLTRGIEFSYEAVRDWEAKLTPPLIDNLRRRRKGRIGNSWYVDETYIRVNGHWCYLYRAIDRSGALVDVRLSEKRDMAAAKAFFRSAKAVTGVTPARVTPTPHADTCAARCACDLVRSCRRSGFVGIRQYFRRWRKSGFFNKRSAVNDNAVRSTKPSATFPAPLTAVPEVGSAVDIARDTDAEQSPNSANFLNTRSMTERTRSSGSFSIRS